MQTVLGKNALVVYVEDQFTEQKLDLDFSLQPLHILELKKSPQENEVLKISIQRRRSLVSGPYEGHFEVCLNNKKIIPVGIPAVCSQTGNNLSDDFFAKIIPTLILNNVPAIKISLRDGVLILSENKESSTLSNYIKFDEQKFGMFISYRAMPKNLDGFSVRQKIDAFIQTLSYGQPYRAFYNAYGIAIEVLLKDTQEIWYSGNLEDNFQTVETSPYVPSKSGYFISKSKDFALKIKDENSSLLNDSPCEVIHISKLPNK